MALKFFVLLLVVCAAQARTPTNAAELRARYHEWLKNPFAHFVGQAHEKYHDRVSGLVPQWYKPSYEKFHDMILNGFNKPQAPAQEKPEVTPEAKPEVAEKPDPMVVYQCAVAHKGQINDVASFARDTVEKEMNELKAKVDVEKHPDLGAKLDEFKAQGLAFIGGGEVVKLIDAGDVEGAFKCLNKNRQALDDTMKEMVRYVKENAPEMSESAMKADQVVYDEPKAEVTKMMMSFQTCVQNGGK